MTSQGDTSGTMPDLAAARGGGMVLAASDEFFAPKERLLDPRPPVFDPDRYTARGKVMDGWESRRRRDPGSDWCVVRLGRPGIVRDIVVDTSFFRGNHPQACTVEGCTLDADPPVAQVLDERVEWVELFPRSPLEGDTVHRFPVTVDRRFTHVRLWIHPDGGVARLRLHGEPLEDLRRAADPNGRLDLAASAAGGSIAGVSDLFFAHPRNLIGAGDARDMGDGWETRRRRGAGHDWAVVALATSAVVDRVEVDTTHFKGNHPDHCTVEVCDAPAATGDALADADWREVVPSARLGPHARHIFDVTDPGPASHVRLNIFPDGGVARLRVHGTITDDGWRRSGTRWLDAQPAGAAETDLRACCASTRWVERVVAGRPHGSFETLCGAADRIWEALDPDDWLEAFAAHPRIGERSTSAWSQQEQAGATAAEADIQRQLVDGNAAYEERFGHGFLVSATGKSGDEILAALHTRMGNDPDTELRVAAEQQRQITRLRLDKLMRPARPAGGVP